MSFNHICLPHSSQLPSRPSSLASECAWESIAVIAQHYLHGIPTVEDLPGDIQVSTFKPSSTPTPPHPQLSNSLPLLPKNVLEKVLL